MYEDVRPVTIARRMGEASASDRVTVVVADDSALYRQGLVRFLRQDPAVELLAEAETGDEALAVIVRERPSVALLDVRMPGLDGHEVAEALPADLDVAVLLLSAGPPPPMPQRPRCAFLPKTDPRSAILELALQLARS